MRNLSVIPFVLMLGACQTYSNNTGGEYIPRSSTVVNSAYQAGPVYTSNRESMMRSDGLFYRLDTGIIDSSATCEHYGGVSQICLHARDLRVSGAVHTGKESVKHKYRNFQRWLAYCRPRGVCWDDAQRRAGDWWRSP